ncbi:MAG: hypothetical protein PHE02_02105 [Lachnospiraceae bacterium]|nr:hypothetical protein [Lachnospiraceae bacterium]
MNQFNFHFTWKHFTGMLLGNMILGLGIAIFKFSNLGNDPFSAMMMGLADKTPLEYAALTAILNTFLFIIEFIWGKQLIGLGTLINWFFLAYFATFFYDTMTFLLPNPSHFFIQILYLIIGIPIISFGVSLYQASDSGIAPYDSISLIMDAHMPIPYFWCRLFTDFLCAFLCFLSGGLLGIGTLTCAFCLGPFISFFNHKITFALMGHEEEHRIEKV